MRISINNFKQYILAATCFAFLLCSATDTFAIEIGENSPNFSLEQQGGGQINLSDYSGSVVFLDFWASWCSSCKKSFPWINTLHNKYKDKDFKVIAINIDSDRKAAIRFLESMNIDFSVAYDPDGVTPAKYQLKAMPSSFLIGRDGKIISSFSGFKNDAKVAIEKQLEKLLFDQ